MTIRRITDVDLDSKRVLIRADFNVPLSGTRITSDLRIRAALPTIEYALEQGASVAIVSHLGRPQVGGNNAEFSLAPVQRRLAELLDTTVNLATDWQHNLVHEAGKVTLLENIRFQAGETKNDLKLAEQLAKSCDVFVNDAFGTAHRAHSSTAGITQFTPISCAGLLLASEINALERAIKNPKRPLVAVIGGAKISGKLELLQNLGQLADTLLIGGGMANTFLMAHGHSIGKSLVEPSMIGQARDVMASATIPLPVDVMTSSSECSSDLAFLRLHDSIPSQESIVDIGPETARRFAKIIAGAGTIIWNGPMGIFERTVCAEGTRVVAEAIADSEGFSLAGGGDTVAAIEKYQLSDKIDYISTGGGAFLEFIEGKKLPGIEALRS